MPRTSADVRDQLIRALEADLVGPFHPSLPEEELTLAPSRFYQTGFLAPLGAREEDDPTEDDELGAGSDDDAEDAEEPAPRQRFFLPASIGLSVLLPEGDGGVVHATVAWADYEPIVEAEDGRKTTAWRRHPGSPVTLDLPLDDAALRRGVEIEGSRGVRLTGLLEPVPDGAPSGRARALSLFVVNRREAAPAGQADAAFLFQVQLAVHHEGGLVPRPERRGEAGEWDDRVADLQFRERVEWAVGHGVSVEAIEEDGRVVGARTAHLPQAEVHRVVTNPVDGLVDSMDALAKVDATSVTAALAPLVEAYGTWLAAQADRDVGGGPRAETRDELVKRARRARERIRAGIDLLAADATALEAFRLANQAMADAARRRRPEEPRWRAFQLAFVLLNLPALVDPTRDDRDDVELVYFPTGGGKTEAYLGVIAFLLVHRRLARAAEPDRGLGVAVLLRYTLRLLTLDQLGRAATLICALELLRRADPRLGDTRFSVGLWVGRSATANTLKEVAERIVEFKNATYEHAASPFPLAECPWCGKRLGKDSFDLKGPRTNPTDVLVGCSNFRDCPFTGQHGGLPVLFVDESIYRELPSFLVATVDKFASLPWRGATARLFGRVRARDGRSFVGAADDPPPATATPLPAGLLPPELIVQDELHLITGPLGTMVGLYEAAIDELCTRRVAGRAVRPKIIASTATVRRAREQIEALFGRGHTSIFPPPGVDDSETFFASVDRGTPGRRYVGVATPGRALKATLLRTYLALLAAGESARREDADAADPYLTLVGYFNALRELSGMRRLVEDEVFRRLPLLADRLPRNWKGDHPHARGREIREPVELTSRESTWKIAEAKRRLALPHADRERVDLALASNMISVGVDVTRLGLMVVAGQPKTTSEYIQATSRVGREAGKPGLVVTVYNPARPRDRSHFERFPSYHAAFYRHVEAGSVTPFSGPALDRGLAAVLVALARLGDDALTPSSGVMRIAEERPFATRMAEALADRARRAGAAHVAADLRLRSLSLLDAWEAIVRQSREEAGGKRSYSSWEKEREGKPLLSDVLADPASLDEHEARFHAPTSLRDVERTAHVWLARARRTDGR